MAERCRYCNAAKNLNQGKCVDREGCFRRTVKKAEEAFDANKPSLARQANQRILYEASRREKE